MEEQKVAETLDFSGFQRWQINVENVEKVKKTEQNNLTILKKSGKSMGWGKEEIEKISHKKSTFFMKSD